MIDKLLVCLDLSPYDKVCVEQAVQLCSRLPTVREVVLLHNIRFDFLASVPEFRESDYERMKYRIEEAIAKRFSGQFSEGATPPRISVTTDGNPIDAIKKELGEAGRTLLIVGHKRRKDGAGNLPLRILQLDKYRSPVLFCPKQPVPLGAEIVVATDLSRRSPALYRFARFFGESLPAKVISLHISKLPMAYFPYVGKDNVEMEKQLLRAAEKKVTAFIAAQTELAVDRFVTLSSNNVARSIGEFFTDSTASLLLLNRSGKSNLRVDYVGGITRGVVAEPMNKLVLIT